MRTFLTFMSAALAGLVVVAGVALAVEPDGSTLHALAWAYMAYGMPLLLLVGCVAVLLSYRHAEAAARAEALTTEERMQWLRRLSAPEIVDHRGETWAPGRYMTDVMGHLWRAQIGPYSFCHRPGCRLKYERWNGRTPCREADPQPG